MFAFLAVTLVGVSAVAWLADWSLGTEFPRYLSRQELLSQNELLNALTEYYRQHGNWTGVASVFSRSTLPSDHVSIALVGRPSLLLADQYGTIVFDERGIRQGGLLTALERWNGLTILQGENVVGYLYAPPPGRDAVTPAALEFLNDFQNTLAVMAIIVGGLAVAISVIVSRTIAAPLTNLAVVANAFARHDWNRRANTRGAVEIARVARAFNAMADELQRYESLQRSSITDIAHELRTPLTVLQGNLRALLDHVYPLDEGEIAKLYDQTRLLSRLVDDLRELALAESQPCWQHETVKLSDVLEAVASEVATIAEAREVQLNLHACPELSQVCADPDRVKQILLNLLSNALRHSPAGSSIEVCTETLPPDTASQFVQVSVVDHGEGIPSKDLPNVFERFYRVDKARSRDVGGSGLGLAIAKAWVEAMGGTIGVESELGCGSRFWFTLAIVSDKTLA